MRNVMQIERRVSLFSNGRNQALRIPRDFKLPGQEATMRKEDNRLIVEPVAKPTLLAVLAMLYALDEALPDIENPVPAEVDL